MSNGGPDRHGGVAAGPRIPRGVAGSGRQDGRLPAGGLKPDPPGPVPAPGREDHPPLGWRRRRGGVHRSGLREFLRRRRRIRARRGGAGGGRIRSGGRPGRARRGNRRRDVARNPGVTGPRLRAGQFGLRLGEAGAEIRERRPGLRPLRSALETGDAPAQAVDLSAQPLHAVVRGGRARLRAGRGIGSGRRRERLRKGAVKPRLRGEEPRDRLGALGAQRQHLGLHRRRLQRQHLRPGAAQEIRGALAELGAQVARGRRRRPQRTGLRGDMRRQDGHGEGRRESRGPHRARGAKGLEPRGGPV